MRRIAFLVGNSRFSPGSGFSLPSADVDALAERILVRGVRASTSLLESFVTTVRA